MTNGIDPAATPSGTGCVDCDAAGGWWVHLRRCAQCGHVGCCDSSPAQHATAHAGASGHPVVQSFEPGEDWFWDYERAGRHRPRAGRADVTARSTSRCPARPSASPPTGSDHIH